MKSYLSKVALLTTCYLLLTTNIYAQEITATITPTPTTPPQQFSPYAKSLSDFIGSLVTGLKKNRIEQLGDINRGMLPPIEFTTFESQKGIKLQSTAETEDLQPPTEARPIYKATEDYAVGNALRSPAVSNESLSTNLVDFFAGLVKSVADVTGIAKIGDQKAEELVRSNLPPSLDIQSNKEETMMEKGLPYLWCAGSLQVLCQDNKPRWAEEK